MIFDKQNWDALEDLQKSGFKIIIFEDGSVFVYSTFVPADTTAIKYHKLSGVRVFLNDARILSKDKDTIFAYIDNLQSVSLWIHSDVKYVLFE